MVFFSPGWLHYDAGALCLGNEGKRLRMLFRFGDYDLDCARRELRRSDDPVHVEPQVFDLLTLLVANRDRVVKKDEIIASVWKGRAISEVTLNSRINAARRAIGDDGKRQALIRTVPRCGFRFVGDARNCSVHGHDGGKERAPLLHDGQTSSRLGAPAQEVRFVRNAEGINIAVARSGTGMPLVKTGTWLTHVEHDWQGSVWAPMFWRLAGEFQLVRYDPRGCGLSDWQVREMSFEGMVRDLETVVDALGLERFALFGISQGAAVSIAYAVRHPERVSHVVLSGGYALGWRKRGGKSDVAAREALLSVIEHGWGRDTPVFRQIFTAHLWPDAYPEQMDSLRELTRLSASPENAVRLQQLLGEVDVTDLLSSLAAPTLVLHSRDDALPISEGLRLARGIPDARFVEIASRNHVPLAHEPAWHDYLGEIEGFLKPDL